MIQMSAVVIPAEAVEKLFLEKFSSIFYAQNPNHP